MAIRPMSPYLIIWYITALIVICQAQPYEYYQCTLACDQDYPDQIAKDATIATDGTIFCVCRDGRSIETTCAPGYEKYCPSLSPSPSPMPSPPPFIIAPVKDSPKTVVVAPVKDSPSPDPVIKPADTTPVPPVKEVEAPPAAPITPKTVPVKPSTPVAVKVPSPVPQKTVSPKPVALLTPPPATTTTSDSDDGGSNTAAIVGGVVGGVAVIALIAGGVWYWRKRKQAVPGVHLQAQRNDGWVDPLDNAAVKVGSDVVAPSSTAPFVVVE